MLADVQMMYMDLAEMAEEGYFPDGLPSSLAREKQACDTPGSETLMGLLWNPRTLCRCLRT
jgi:hypothetical protein